MSTEWYCEIVGEVVGPLKASQLLDMVRAGEITRDTLVRKDDSQWVPAMEVNGLFDAAKHEKKQKAKTLGFICPYCGESVSKAPTECSNCERYLNRVIPLKEEAGKPLTSDSPAEESNNGQGNGNSAKKPKRSRWQRFWSMD